jgi:hypothetical protein
MSRPWLEYQKSGTWLEHWKSGTHEEGARLVVAVDDGVGLHQTLELL